MTPKEFRDELNRLYMNARTYGLISWDLAAIAKCNRHEMVKWIDGYACPATAEERLSIITALAAYHYPSSEIR